MGKKRKVIISPQVKKEADMFVAKLEQIVTDPEQPEKAEKLHKKISFLYPKEYFEVFI